MARKTLTSSDFPCNECTDRGLNMSTCEDCKLRKIHEQLVAEDEALETSLFLQHYETLALQQAQEQNY
jgi:hypothetical protein